MKQKLYVQKKDIQNIFSLFINFYMFFFLAKKKMQEIKRQNRGNMHRCHLQAAM